MDHGRVRPMTTSRNMAALLGLIPSLAALVYNMYSASLILNIHAMVNDTCQNKVSADQCHVTISRAQV